MEQMTSLLAQHGLALVFANVFVHQAGIPIPISPLLIVAGALVQQGHLSLPALMTVTVLASLTADVPWFLLGRRYGYPILNTLCRIAIEPDSCVKRTESIFERWGAPSLLVAKFIPGFAMVAPPLAGTLRLPLVPFIAYSAMSAALWAAVPIGAGMLFHAEIEQAIAWLEGTGPGVIAALVGVIAFYVAMKWLERWYFIRLLRMVRVSANELHQMLQRDEKPMILDARSAVARRTDSRRLPGAVAVDIEKPDPVLVAVPPERDIVVYCS